MSTILMIGAAVALPLVTSLDSKRPGSRSSFNCTTEPESKGSAAMGIIAGGVFAILLAMALGLIG